MRGGQIRLLLAVFLLLAAIPLASAADTSIYDKWHFSGDSFTADGEVLAVTHFRITDEKIYLTINKQGYTVKLNECLVTDTKKYCFAEMFNNINIADSDDHIKFEGNEAYAGLRIKIYKRDSKITVTRTFSKTNPDKGDEVKVEVKITNPTEFRTKSFLYQDQYPEGVILVSGSGEFEKGYRGVTLDSNIEADSEKTLTYTIRFTDYAVVNNQASYTYEVEGSKYSANTTAYKVDLSSQKPYSLTLALSSGSIEAGGDSKLTITLQNKYEGELAVDYVELSSLGSNLSITTEPLSSNALKKAASENSWYGTLKEDESATLTVKIKGNNPGKYQIPVSVRAQGSEGAYVEKKNITLTVSYKEPELVMSLKDNVIAEGGKTRLAFSVKNPNKILALRDVQATISSPFFASTSGSISEIRPGATETLVVIEEITGPDVENETSYTINASGKYSTRFSEKAFSKSVILKITPVNKSVAITHALAKPADIRPGSNITVTVNIQYLNEEKVEVEAKDSYSPGLTFNGGLTQETLAFDKSGTKQAYIYNVVVPQNYRSKELNITTKVSIKGRAETISKTTILPVNITTSPAEAAASNENQGSEETTTSSSNTEQGAVSKAVNGVMGFFRRLLGFSK
jgi:hypothetical protein